MSNILVVDDRPLNRSYLVTLLGYQGHTIAEAQDGRQALEIAKRQPIDLVITDMLMPVMDGMELAKNLRQDAGLRSIPVIFYTATYNSRDASRMAEAAGVSGVLHKPAEPQDILAAVERALGSPKPPDTDQSRVPPGQLTTMRLAALIESGLDLTSERSPAALLDKFVRCARDLVGCRCAVAGIVEDGHLSVMSAAGVDAHTLAGLQALDPLAAPFDEVINATRAIRLQTGNGFGASGIVRAVAPERCLLIVPIASTDTYGWLLLVDRLHQNQFTDHDERIAMTVAGQAAVSYGHATMSARLVTQAERLLQEAALRNEAEGRLRETVAIMEEIFDGIETDAFWSIHVPTMTVEYSSKTLEGVLGVSPTAVFGEWTSLVHPEDRELVAGVEAQVSLGNKASADLRIVKPDGAVRWIHAHMIPQADGSGNVTRVTGVVRDVTESKQLEQQLRQAQKMETVGRLAGGVAHDFNNYLTPILGYTEMAMDTLGADNPVTKDLMAVRASATKAAELTRRLLAFSRREPSDPRVMDVNSVVRSMEKLLRGLIGEDICLETRLAEGLWSVRADPAQLEQLLMNLAANARDAMPSGGTLTISTENVEGRRPGAMGGTHKVALTITDTGTGLSPEVLAHLFEPFFTTKEKGHGTGLGLSTCFGIARQNNGQITGDNLPGGGARFQVVLPRAEGAAQETGREVAAGSEAKDGWGVVMVVEDEAGVRQLTARVLKDHGYQVLEAPDGQEAMTMARVLRAEVRLLVTDLVMPGMTGAELAERWRGVHPESKVLFMSGYTPEAIQSRLGKVAGAQVLRKPFSRVGLLNAVRAALLG